VLLKTPQHREIALITTVSLKLPAHTRCSLLGSTMLRHGGAGKEKREGADAKDVVVHGTLRHDGAVDGRTDRARTAGIEKSREGVTGSDHHAAGFEAFLRQTIPCHRFDHVPVLTEIARSLMLGRKFGLQTASLARISVRDLKKHCLLSLFRVGLRPRSIAHRLFLCERRQA
jgi:hypothetical protein